MKKNIVILGGGFSGIISALLLNNKTDDYNMHIIEKESNLGGLFSCFDYQNKGGLFDYGAHCITPTKIPDIDDLILNTMAKSEWEITPKAFSGLIYNNKLQTHSAYIDLRNHKKINYFQKSFLYNLDNKRENNINENAYNYCIDLFSKEITDEILVDCFYKLYSTHPKYLDPSILNIFPFKRILLFDQEQTDILTKKYKLNCLGCQDQNKLQDCSNLTAYYPKKYGIYRVVEKMHKILLNQKVKIHYESNITAIEFNNNQVTKIKINDKEITDIDLCINTLGLPFICSQFNYFKPFDKGGKTVLVNILLDKKILAKNMCFIYCYDKNFKTFRIDNYFNYCADAVRNNYYPITLELFLDDKDTCDIKQIEELALKELYQMPILEKDTKVKFVKAEILKQGFPLFSCKNIESMDNLRNYINSKNIKNLINIGVGVEKGIWLINHIKKDLYFKLTEFLKK